MTRASAKAVLDVLCKKGVLTVAEQDKSHRSFASIPFDPQPLTLSAEQQKVLRAAAGLGGRCKPHAALLYGVTGSGKTVVFLKLIERTLELGRRALVLVPEISLTPQMIRRLKSTFGSRLAVQHSALNNTERLLQWRMIQDGECRHRGRHPQRGLSRRCKIGLIIMDEEQEHTYRRVNLPPATMPTTRQKARWRKTPCCFASATPPPAPRPTTPPKAAT